MPTETTETVTHYLLAMSSGRLLSFAGGGLLVAWLAAANMPSQDPDRALERARPDDPVPPAAIAEDVHSQAARLQARMARAPVPESSPRNPFTFGAIPRPAAPEVRAAAAPAEPEVFEPPPPALTLMGVAEEYVIGGYRRTAVIGGDGDAIFMVMEGDRVGDRYKVTKIGADAVELEDLVNKGYRRLALR
jgi:hypothetical protein